MIYPEELTPTGTMSVLIPAGRAVNLPVCHPIFKKWAGEPPNFDFGTKPLIDYRGKCVFAELAILGMFIDSDWDGVWVSTYQGTNYLKEMPKSSPLSGYKVPIPADKKALLLDIWKPRKKGGCFDVFAWKDKDILFCEGKHKGKDTLTDSQVKFITGALACGVSPQSLMLVEWEFRV